MLPGSAEKTESPTLRMRSKTQQGSEGAGEDGSPVKDPAGGGGMGQVRSDCCKQEPAPSLQSCFLPQPHKLPPWLPKCWH